MEIPRRIWSGSGIAIAALLALLTPSGTPALAGSCEVCGVNVWRTCSTQESGKPHTCVDTVDGCASWEDPNMFECVIVHS